ncbi:MAG: hypothetical protein J6X18_13235, partial [Bacteroidales bacterium]|nr:hypothetical protein [Bacteroidales bacterium]
MKKIFKIKKSVVEGMVDEAIKRMVSEGKLHEGKEYKTVELDDDTTLRVTLYTVNKRNGACEYAEGYIFTPDRDYNSVGKYCFTNRAWQRFDYEKALIQMIHGLPEQYQEKAMDELVNSRVWECKNRLMESFKSQKLKNFARAHGGLKQGKWSADFKNDLYNMSDEDFEDYKIVNPDEHYRQYGLNGWDTIGYSNNNFQPIMFGDGTFMVKKNPDTKWDDRAKGMMNKQIDRRNSRRNDGKNEYQFENPYLHDKFNQDYHISKPRGSWGYGTDWNLEPSNINMTALRSMEGYDKYPGDVKPGDVAAKVKSSRKLSENQFRDMVKECVKRVLKEGAYGYPDTVDGIILCSENDRELYNEYVQIAKAVAKVYKRDAKLSFERLVDSSILKRYQQHCFGRYGKENPDKDRVKSPRIFREYVAKKIIDEVLDGKWDERKPMNEGYGKRKDKMPNGDEGYWLTDIDYFGGYNNDFIKADIGYVNDTRKTVLPNHGYYYPNKRSLALMKYAMNLGYRYDD